MISRETERINRENSRRSNFKLTHTYVGFKFTNLPTISAIMKITHKPLAINNLRLDFFEKSR